MIRFSNLTSRLFEAAQRSLGRMSLADRASALIKSAIYAAALDDFSVSAKGGPEAQLLFERIDGSDLSGLRVPGIYTYAGFNNFYLGQLSRIAQMLVDDQWVLGGGGEQGDIDQELLKLGPELLDRYGKEFAAAWNSVLDELKFKAMLTDKPHYIALSAAASPTSPIEPALCGDRQRNSSDARPRLKATVLAPRSKQARFKTSRRTPRISARAWPASAYRSPPANRKAAPAQGPPTHRTSNPGANIEAQFRSFQALVNGPAGRRPIDALTQNFSDIYQSLQLAAEVPSQTERVNTNLQLQIATLRANVSRLPKQLAPDGQRDGGRV